MSNENIPLLVIGGSIGSGGIDVTDYITQGAFSESEEPLYEEDEFRNMLGETRRTLIGTSVRISVTLSLVPADEAETVIRALSAGDEDNKVRIKYVMPVSRDMMFDMPSCSSSAVFLADAADSTSVYYDISFDASGTVPLDGL